jgi:membrane fusion protein, heavy metal efflux system
MRKYNFLKAVLFTLFVIALVSCGSGNKTKTDIKEAEVIPEDIVELREDQVKLADIETGSIELRSLSGTLKVSGTVTTSPQNLATVCLPMGGFVKNTLIVAGSAVSKGQILAVVENQDFVDIQQNYLEAKNKLEYAEAEFKRHTELYKEDVYSQKNLQQVTSDYKSLKAQVKALEQKLSVIGINPSLLNEDNITSDIQVVSPISGYIKSVNINIGKYVAPSDAMFEIVNNNNPLLELTLFEKDADKAVNGQNIRFFINNETEQHTATIYQTGKSIGTDKTYKVYARVEGRCKNVLPGMYVNAIIETSMNKVTALPSEAIVSFDDKDYIFVYERAKEEEGKSFTEYRMLQVQEGSSDNGYTEVKLPENFDIKKSRVVVKGAYNLLSAKMNAGEMAC